MTNFKYSVFLLCLFLIACAEKSSDFELLTTDKSESSGVRSNSKIDREADVELPVTATALEADSPELLTLLSKTLSERLAYPSTVKIETLKQNSSWLLTCGVPLDESGAEMDYSRTLLAEELNDGLVDDYFCALIQRANSGLEIREFVVGATDTPILDWIDRYDLPDSIF